MKRLIVGLVVFLAIHNSTCWAQKKEQKVDPNDLAEVLKAVEQGHARLAGYLENIQVEGHTTDVARAGTPDEETRRSEYSLKRGIYGTLLLIKSSSTQSQKQNRVSPPGFTTVYLTSKTDNVMLMRKGLGSPFEVVAHWKTPTRVNTTIRAAFGKWCDRSVALGSERLVDFFKTNGHPTKSEPVLYEGKQAVKISFDFDIPQTSPALEGAIVERKGYCILSPKDDWCLLESSAGHVNLRNNTQSVNVEKVDYQKGEAIPTPAKVIHTQTHYAYKNGERGAITEQWSTVAEFTQFSYAIPPKAAFEPSAFELPSFENLTGRPALP